MPEGDDRPLPLGARWAGTRLWRRPSPRSGRAGQPGDSASVRGRHLVATFGLEPGTTERYLHARPATELADRFTTALGGVSAERANADARVA
jgi:hypothetical protein